MNLKGGYIILDLGVINGELESGTITDDTIFSSNFTGKQLKEKLKEIHKIEKPVLLIFATGSSKYIKFSQIGVTNNSISLHLLDDIFYDGEGTLTTVEQISISYSFTLDELYYDYVYFEA